MHVCGRKKGYIWHLISVAALLDKSFQDSRENGLSEKKYYCCVMNTIIKGKQFTILWHVGDKNVLYVGYDVVSEVLADLTKSMERFKNDHNNG